MALGGAGRNGGINRDHPGPSLRERVPDGADADHGDEDQESDELPRVALLHGLFRHEVSSRLADSVSRPARAARVKTSGSPYSMTA